MTRPLLALLVVLLALANGATAHARRWDVTDQIVQVADDDVAPFTVVVLPELPVRVDLVIETHEPAAPVIVHRPVLVLAPKTSPPQAQ